MFDEKLVRSLCEQTQEELLKNLKTVLKKFKYRVVVTDKYLLAEGRDPICLIAHLDTVGAAPPTAIYYDSEAEVMWSPQLLGADDRAGVYAILKIVERGLRPSIIFTTDEEKGAIGAEMLTIEHLECPFKKVPPKLLVQLDRRGSHDSVFYDCDNPEFEKYINSFDFKTAIGTFSDISVIAPQWEIAAVNLSVGYYNEHQLIETLKGRELEETVEKVAKMVKDSHNLTAAFEYIECEYGYGKIFYAPAEDDKRCIFCTKECNNKNGKYMDKYGKYSYWVCNDCYKRYYS